MVVHNKTKTPRTLFHPAAVLVLLLFVAVRAFAGSVTLAWDPVTSPALAGYMLYYGPAAGSYTSKVDVGNATTRTVSNLTDGATYHFAVTAYDASHTESGFSNDVSTTLPGGAPVANFTASATSGVAPLAMNFSNMSTGSITSYAWAFGDGTTSTAKAPSHVYTAAGIYTVSLTVIGSSGSNTRTIVDYVNVAAPAKATTTTIGAAPNPSTAGSTVTFTATVAGSV